MVSDASHSPGTRNIKKLKDMPLPQDPFMLMSMINMKLRDGDYESLSDLCRSLDIDENSLKDKLRQSGFDYIESVRQFR